MAPKFRVGTRFLKEVPGRGGEFEGVITSNCNGKYSVTYDDIDFQETVSEEMMCSDSVTVTTNWETDLLKEGQAVWAFIKKNFHPAQILSIRRSEEKALVKWTTSDTKGEVDLHFLFPMFDSDEYGGMVTSSKGKRKKMATNFYVVWKAEIHRASFQRKSKVKEDPEPEVASKKGKGSGKKRIKYQSAKVKCSNSAKRKASHPVKQSERKMPVKTEDHTEEKEPTKQGEQINSKAPSCRPKQEGENYLESKGWVFEGGWWVSPQLKKQFRLVDAKIFDSVCEKYDRDEATAFCDYINLKCVNKSVGTSVKDEVGETEGNTSNENEYTMLWEYYMHQKVRLNEEIPSGIQLRAKIVQCPLLRSKNVFRQQVHKKVLALNRSGKRKEIHRILKKLYEHDISGRCGDGPTDLLKEFTGVDQEQAEFFDGEVKVEAVEQDTVAKASAVTVEDLTLGVSCDHTSLSSLTGSPPLAAYSARYDVSNNSVESLANDVDMKMVELLSDIDTTESVPCEIDDKKPASVAAEISYTDDIYNIPTPVKQPKSVANFDIIDLVDDDETKPPAAGAVLDASSELQTRTKFSEKVIDLVDDDDDSNLPVVGLGLKCSGAENIDLTEESD